MRWTTLSTLPPDGQGCGRESVVEEAAAVSQVDQEVFQAAYALAAIPARYALERRRWSEAAELQVAASRMFLGGSFGSPKRSRILRARWAQPAVAIRPSARAEIEELGAIQQSAVANTQQDYDWASQVEVQRLGAAAWVLHAEGHNEAALR